MSLRLSALAALLGALTGCASSGATGAAQPCALPASAVGDGWEVQAPEAAGFDAQALCAVLTRANQASFNLHGLVIERHGRLVAELYRRGPDHPIDVWYGLPKPFSGEVDFGPTTRHDLRSISKSFVSMLIGIARAQGKLGSLSTPALDFYPQLSELRSPERQAIDLEHLLTMSSGLKWDEGSLPNDETSLYWASEQARFVLSKPIAAAPGQQFHYDSGGTAVLADVLVRATGRPLRELARTELFEPLGITDWEWATDTRGRELAFTGLRMRPRDLAKVGRMLLDHGQWQGQQVVPADWVAESMRPHLSTGLKSPPDAAHELQYGYQWWAGATDWQGHPVSWSAGFGNGGQRLFVAPELDLAVVTTSGDYGSAEVNQAVNQLFNEVIATVKG